MTDLLSRHLDHQDRVMLAGAALALFCRFAPEIGFGVGIAIQFYAWIWVKP